jgi:dihydrofolate synthase/folylpolyglutamate synthase
MPKLVGAHQLENAGAALACIHVIDSFPIHAEFCAAGLTRVRWAARLQPLTGHPLTTLIPANWDLWLDGGHNDSAGQVLAHQAHQWHTQDAYPLHLVMGMKRDKEAGPFLQPLLPYLASLRIVPIPGIEAESYTAAEIRSALGEVGAGLDIQSHESIKDALRPYQKIENPARVLIAGSLYLAGAVLQDR